MLPLNQLKGQGRENWDGERRDIGKEGREIGKGERGRGERWEGRRETGSERSEIGKEGRGCSKRNVQFIFISTKFFLRYLARLLRFYVIK